VPTLEWKVGSGLAHEPGLERPAGNKPSSLIGPFISCKKTVVNLQYFIFLVPTSWQAFPAYSNVCGQGQVPTLEWKVGSGLAREPGLERPARNKQSSLMGPFVSCEKTKLLLKLVQTSEIFHNHAARVVNVVKKVTSIALRYVYTCFLAILLLITSTDVKYVDRLCQVVYTIKVLQS
jgi:hypothetical protein